MHHRQSKKYIKDANEREKANKQNSQGFHLSLLTSHNRAIRDEKIAIFTEKGQPGEKLRAKYENLIKALKVPQSIYDAELDSIMRFVESILEST